MSSRDVTIYTCDACGEEQESNRIPRQWEESDSGDSHFCEDCIEVYKCGDCYFVFDDELEERSGKYVCDDCYDEEAV